jgi:hypothetical protein
MMVFLIMQSFLFFFGWGGRGEGTCSCWLIDVALDLPILLAGFAKWLVMNS